MDRSLLRALKQTITVIMITQTVTSRILMTTAAATPAADEPPTCVFVYCQEHVISRLIVLAIIMYLK